MIRFIETHRERFGVEPICRELQVAPQAYYAARQRPRSARRIRDEALQVQLRQVHAEHFGVYGARKFWRQLTREGIPVARCTVERPMPALSLSGVVRGKSRRTTATREWVDWFNHRRLSSAIGYVPPAEYEASQYCESVPAPAGTQ